jgi:hypothetical protein
METSVALDGVLGKNKVKLTAIVTRNISPLSLLTIWIGLVPFMIFAWGQGEGRNVTKGCAKLFAR